MIHFINLSFSYVKLLAAPVVLYGNFSFFIHAEDSTMASPPSIASEYDPKNDPARKPQKSKDLGWKYGYWPNLQNKDEVKCTLCGTSVRGGIKRLKQHLAGGYGDAVLCESKELTTEIRKEMSAYLEANKRKRPLFLEEDDGESKVVEVTAEQASENRSSSQKEASNNKTKAANTMSIAEMVRETPEEMVDERLAGSYQPTIQSKVKSKEEKDYVDMLWALFFYECGVPFNAAAARQFQIAIEATAQYGSRYMPPTPHQLGEPLLQK